MKLYMVDDFTGKINPDSSLLKIRTVEGETPIKAARNLKIGKIRKARTFENPDLILTEVRSSDGRLCICGNKNCYVVTE